MSVLLRVGIDNISPGASTGHQAIGGMRHFLEGIVTQLPTYAPEYAFELFTPTWGEDFGGPLPPNLGITRCPGVPTRPAGRVLYEHVYLPRQLRRRGVNLWLASCNMVPLLWRGPSVLIVQSLQYLGPGVGFPWARRVYLQRMGVRSLQRATRLVTFSQAAKRDIVERGGVPESQISVIPHAVRFPDGPMSVEENDRAHAAVRDAIGVAPYVLCVSAFYPYKNLFRLLEAFARLKPELPHKLVLAGAETAAVPRAALAAAADRLRIAQDVVFLGRVSDAELRVLYRGAAVMAMPSLEETFGLPVLEAMALGCPVVTSNVSSMPEIAGGAAVLVDPFDVEGIADGLRRTVETEAVRRQMIDAGRARAREFTYERFFRQLVDVIEAAAS